MSDIEHLQKVQFYFRLRKEKEHPKLVEMVKKNMGEELKKAGENGLMLKLHLLITNDKENPDYPEAFKMYCQHCWGMSAAELLKYAEYLEETFEFKRPQKYFAFKTPS